MIHNNFHWFLCRFFSAQFGLVFTMVLITQQPISSGGFRGFRQGLDGYACKYDYTQGTRHELKMT